MSLFLNYSDRIKDDGNDYILLADYGSEGMSVQSQHETLWGAVEAMHRYAHAQMTIVKVCRMDIKETDA